MSGQDQYGDYDYTRRSSGSSGEYESQQDYNGRSGDASQYGSRADASGYGGRRAETSYGRGSADSATYGTRTGEQQQAGEYGQPAEYGAREYRSYRRGEYRPRSDYSRSGEYGQTGYGRRGADLGGGGEPPRTRGDVIGVIASSLFAVLAVLALVAVVYIVLNGNRDDSPTSTPQASGSTEPTGSKEPTGGQTTPPAEKAPVIVLNSTDRTGLAADATNAIKADDWETGQPGNYDGGALAQTTVFYPEGMKGSAELLQEQFADITAVKPAKEGMSTSSLTLVLGSDWP